MKSLKQIYKFAFVLPALMLAGCSDDNEPAPTVGADDFEVPSELTLTLSVPDEQVVNLSTRAGEPEAAISQVTVFCYSSTGTTGGFLEKNTVSGSWTSTNGRYEVTVPIHKLTKSVHLVANANVPDAATDPVGVVSSDANAGIMWGRADLKDIIQKGSTITMIRNTAKVSVTSAASGFTFSGFAVGGTSDKGTVAPTGWVTDLSKITAPTLPSGVGTVAAPAAMQAASGEIRVFETQADNAGGNGRIIIEGTYGGVKGYYPVAFRTRVGSGASETPGSYTYTSIPVLRNHHYKVEIQEVRAQGWPTIAEAMKAEPDNRMTVLMTDETPNVTDIIATRDYMLGVNPEAAADSYNSSSVVIELVTSYPGVDGKRYELTASDGWINVADATVASQTTVDMGSAVTGVQYKLNVPLVANDASTIARTGTITVRSGVLVRTISVFQPGRDYKRDPRRKVSVSGLPGLSAPYTSDWFKFVDEVCQGLRPEDNYGQEVLSEGLHFPVVKAYTVTYSIPKLTGDKSAVIAEGQDIFSVKDNGSTYTISLTNPDLKQIATGSLIITNAEGATINYELYRTGYIHQLTSATDTYQREDLKLNGWFYYGVVFVNGQYILDRNLGASSNAPYISTYAGFKDNKRAIGAYFMIGTEKAPSGDEYAYGSDEKNSPSTIIGKLGVSDFVIPAESQVAAWGITSQSVAVVSGEELVVAAIATSGSPVYIPHGGYYEATSPKFETHANIWTRSLLSGNQGFDPKLSPEFGYWYRYLDVYGAIVNFGQMRLANGSGGMAPTANSVFKYMPIRLVWGGN